MDVGYIYILKNSSFQKNLLKIGFTRKNPHERARQLFNGATGVPEPFDVVFACETADYKRAERLIHYYLKAYRVSHRREFFCIPLDVGKSFILDICNEVNIDHGVIINNPVYIQNKINSQELKADNSCYFVSLEDIHPQSTFMSTLTDDQNRRITTVYRILGHLFPDSLSLWLDDFRKDKTPEREINIWEGFAKAFSKVDSLFSLSNDSAREVYTLLLIRTSSKKSDILKEYKSKFFSVKQISEILDCYELKPMPIVVSPENLGA
nr:GIY-YIG nuclease family protein [Serratia proteamaculans]